MCDTSSAPPDTVHAKPECLNPPIDVQRPETPLPGDSRALRRTFSYASIASIATVRAPSPKGVRRRINDIAENLKHKAMKKKKTASTQDAPKNVDHDAALRSKPSPTNKTTKRGRKSAIPLRNSSHKSDEESVLAIADRLHSGIPSELDLPSTFLGCARADPVDKTLCGEDDLLHGSLDLGASVNAERQGTFHCPPTPKTCLQDVQLDIRPSESNVTIWDGLQEEHHLFRCRLYLRCTTHPYDTVPIPDIRCIEMDCNTYPIKSRYARPPALEAAYEGGCVKDSDGLPNIKLAAGIHVDRFWRTVLDDDGTWGWYRDAFVPLSSRLFDKMEYREFKLTSRLWFGESCAEAELTFGISMLLRGVDMK